MAGGVGQELVLHNILKLVFYSTFSLGYPVLVMFKQTNLFLKTFMGPNLLTKLQLEKHCFDCADLWSICCIMTFQIACFFLAGHFEEGNDIEVFW